MRGGKGSILRRSRRERQRHLRETRSNCRKWGGRQSWRQVSGSANGSRGSGHGKTRHLGIVSGGWTEGKVASIYTRLSESRLIAGCVISLACFVAEFRYIRNYQAFRLLPMLCGHFFLIFGGPVFCWMMRRSLYS